MHKYFISFYYGNEHPGSAIFETSFDLDDADDLATFLKHEENAEAAMIASGIHGFGGFVLFNWKKLK